MVMPIATRSGREVVGPSVRATSRASALASVSITTSEQLVKALRVPQQPGKGISKVDIALEAWQSSEFLVPKKAELLSQWVLEHLCSSLRGSAPTSAPSTPNKGKNKLKAQQQPSSSGSSELDLKAWELLASIVTTQISNQSEISEAAKRSWLSHLANTQPVLTLAGKLARQLSQASELSEADREALLSSASVSLAKLLPPATSRTAATNIEAATDALQAWLDLLSQPRSREERRAGNIILQSIVETWTSTLQYGSNAKRNNQHFCTNAVPSLLNALHTLSGTESGSTSGTEQDPELLEVVKRIAAESLFTEDVQRSLLQAGRSAEVTRSASWKETKVATSGIVQQLASLLQAQTTDEAALSSLPILSDLLYVKLSRSEALNSIASSSASSSGSIRETQLSLVRKTMLSEWYFPLLPFFVTPSGSEIAQRRSQRAAARRGLLQGIDEQSLYIMGCDEREEWLSLFKALFESAQKELRQVATEGTPTAQAEIADYFACLTSLWRLEKSVVEDELISIFAMAAVQRVSKQALWLPEELAPSTLAALDFFRAVAAIDVRFRTVPTLINSVLSSIPIAAKLGNVDSLSSSLFTSQTFLAELGKLCRDSVTPMQVPDLIRRLAALAQNVDPVLEDAGNAHDSPKAAKRQRTASSSPSRTDSQSSAHALIVQLQIAAQVVQSVNLAPTLRPRSIAAAQELHDALILPFLHISHECIHADLPSTTYGLAAAALRVRQALLSEKWRYDPSEPVKLDGSLPTESLPCLEAVLDQYAESFEEVLLLTEYSSGLSNSGLYQLQFQIVQSLLQRAERDSFLGLGDSQFCQLLREDRGPIGRLMENLGAMTRPDAMMAATAWTGCANRIEDQDELLQVVWMAIVTRWAALFESLASDDMLTMCAETIIETSIPSDRDQSVKSVMYFITSTALRDASFLELTKWRKAIVSSIEKRLEVHLSGTREHQLADTAPLWITPSDWVDKAARGSLLAKLLTLDKDFVSERQNAFRKNRTADRKISSHWTELRSLLARTLEEYASGSEVSNDVLCDALAALFASEASFVQEDTQPAWEHATLAAVQACVRVLLQKSKQDQATQAKVVEMAMRAREHAAAQSGDKITPEMRAAQVLVAALGDAFTALAKSDAEVFSKSLDAIKRLSAAGTDTKDQLAQRLDVLLYHLREIRLSLVTAKNGTEDDGRAQEVLTALTKDVVATLCVIFSRAATLVKVDSSEDVKMPRQKLLRAAADVALELMQCFDTCGAALAGTEPKKAAALAACIAYSGLIASMPGLQEQRRVAHGLERIVSHLDAEQYDSVLSQLLAALRSTTSATAAASDAKEAAAMDGDEAALISTIGLVVGSAPEGTSKIARSHLSHWLAVLTSSSTVAGSGARIKLRSMVAAVSALDSLCSHHAMLLRTQDMSAVLQLFSTLTGPSMSDEPSPSIVDLPRADLEIIRRRLFDGIISTLSSLMRLRQDLVLGVLPQLGARLARLCTLFRRLRRTDVSGLQRRQLRRDLPSWLDPVHVSPLSADHEARALSRLLSTLTVKNVSLRNRDSGEAKAKAESLARPFSKHATYILVAYLRSLTAPNSVVPADVRAELEVGMMTVCEIIGHHQRDAAMIGLLDSAGKVLLKRIWTEYEKQRYKGQ